MSAASTTIYAKLLNNVGWGTTNLYTNTCVYWNMCIANSFYNTIPNQSNPIIFSNTYNNTSGSDISANMWVMCDNIAVIYINDIYINNNGGWPNGVLYNINLKNGINTFVFYCVNAGQNINPAGFAMNLYSSGTALPESGQITTPPLMYTDLDCTGWKCSIGGFFSNNQPLSTLFLSTTGVPNTLSINAYKNNKVYDFSFNALEGFNPGSSTNNSNYQISGSDVKSSLAPCIPIITGTTVSANSITVNWFFPGVCYAYYLFNTDSNYTTIQTSGTGATNIYDNDSSILLTNNISQKYVKVDVGVATKISQVGNNTYTFTGLAYNTSYPIKVKCYYNAINSSGTTNSVTSSSGNSESAVRNAITYPAAPSINSVSSITSSTATINYTVNTQGTALSVTYYIYSSTSVVLSSSNYTSGTSISSTPTSLSANTTYNLFITASNTSGTTLGNAYNFVTAPPAPSINSVSNITSSTATINYSGGTQGTALTVTYYIYSSTSVVLSSSNYTSGTSISSTPTGLSANTTYNLFITASNTSGTTLGNAYNFVTAPAVATFSTITSTPTTISIPFTVGTQGGALTVTYNAYYSISRISSASGTPATATASPITISSLTPGTTYYLYLTASNSSGSTPFDTSTNSISTKAYIPSISSVSARSGDTKLNVVYVAPSGATGTLYYYFYFTTDNIAPSYTSVLPDNGGSQLTTTGTYTSTSLTGNTKYYVWAAASTQSTITVLNKNSLTTSNIGITESSTSATTGPAPPTKPTVSSQTTNTISVSSTGVTGASISYNYYSDSALTTAVTNGSLSVATVYYITAKQTINSLTSAASDSLTAYTAPDAPSKPTVSSETYNTINVTSTGVTGASISYIYYSDSGLTTAVTNGSLTANTIYYIVAYQTINYIRSANSTALTVYTAPSIPSYGSITKTINSITVPFTYATQSTTTSVTYYVYYDTTNTLTTSNYSTYPSVSSNSSPVIVTTIPPDNYTLLLVAGNLNGKTTAYATTTIAITPIQQATGGTISYNPSSSLKIHTFTSSDTFTIISNITNINVLVTGGGGKSVEYYTTNVDTIDYNFSVIYYGAGGGAGGHYETLISSVRTSYTINISVTPLDFNAGNGSNASFDNIVICGGGGGGGYQQGNNAPTLPSTGYSNYIRGCGGAGNYVVYSYGGETRWPGGSGAINGSTGGGAGGGSYITSSITGTSTKYGGADQPALVIIAYTISL